MCGKTSPKRLCINVVETVVSCQFGTSGIVELYVDGLECVSTIDLVEEHHHPTDTEDHPCDCNPKISEGSAAFEMHFFTPDELKLVTLTAIRYRNTFDETKGDLIFQRI